MSLPRIVLAGLAVFVSSLVGNGFSIAGEAEALPLLQKAAFSLAESGAPLFSDGFEDACPDEPRKSKPGACGCDMPETPECLVHGGKTRDPITRWRVAVILIEFSDTPKSTRAKYPNPKQIEKTFFGAGSTLTEFYSDMSHGHLAGLTGAVYGPFVHPRTLQDLVDSGDYDDPDYARKYLTNTGSAIQIPGFSAEDFEMVLFIALDDYGGEPGGLTNTWTFRINDQDVHIMGTVEALQVGYDKRDPVAPFYDDFALKHSGTVFSPEAVDNGGEIPLDHAGHNMTKFERISAHEIVHAMGIFTHAKSSLGDGYPLARPPDNKLSDFEAEDYGDHFALMGRAEFSVSMTAAYRDSLGWYDKSVKTTLKSIGKHQVTLYPSGAASGARAVEIRLPYQINEFYLPPNFRQNEGYFIEARDSGYKWDSALMNPAVAENTKGVLVTFNDGYTSWLLDMSPSPYLRFDWGEVPDKRDMVLKPGMTFSAPEVTITCTGVTGDGGFLLEVDILGTW